MTVVVGYVPTPAGAAALGLGMLEAGWRKSPILVVNVAVGQNFADVTFADEKDLDAVRGRLSEEGLDYQVEQVLQAQDVGIALVEAARRSDAQLIVLGLRRVSAVGKFLLGSTVQDVMRTADCPVLSVRPPLR